jgi:SAM-dependent methyltransferase
LTQVNTKPEKKISIASKFDTAYSHMAPHYDFLLGHVDYKYWYDYLKMIMHIYRGIPNSILEIGTGTGKFGSYFSRDGYNITGLDLSLSMLQTAKLRAHSNFKIVCGDARQLPFKEKFDFIFSVHDTMNYITDEKALTEVFKSVKKVMNKDSIFLFDMTTEFNVLTNFDTQLQSFEHHGWIIHWYNEYDRKKRIIKSLMSFEKGEIKKEEIHIQKIYTTTEVRKILDSIGFQLIELYGDYSYEKPGPSTIMKNFVVRKKVRIS